MILRPFLISCGLAALVIKCRADLRTLLFLERGSGHSLNNLWSQQSYNDAFANKSLANFTELQNGGTFKANIDSTWGTATSVEVTYLNEYGDQLQLLYLDLTSKDVNVLSNWFETSSFLFSGNTVGANVQLQASNGNNEFIVKSSTTGITRAIVYHEDSSQDPTIMLAVNSSTTMTSGALTSSFEGCYADWELDFVPSFTDAVGMTVAACLSTCSTSFSAIRTADRCYCVEFKTQIYNLAYMCDLYCPGSDGNYCGGTSDGYFSVYSGSAGNNLDTLTVSQQELLSIEHTGNYEYVINITEVLQAHGWVDDILYFDGISVDAINSTGDNMLYSIEFSKNKIDFFPFEPNGNLYFDTDGSMVNTSIRIEGSIKIFYEWTVTNSTIRIYGPPAHSFVDVPYMQISANFQETNSTTTASTPSSTNNNTTTTSSSSTMSSSVADIYNVFSNMSILINGTLYCPCNATNDTYPGLTSIYDNTNLTFEERIKDLTLDPDTLSSNTRRYESATDNRPSATTLGTFGLVIIITLVGLIVYLDSSTLVMEAKRIKKTVKVCKKKWNSKTTKVQSIKIDQNEEDIPIPDVLKF